MQFLNVFESISKITLISWVLVVALVLVGLALLKFSKSNEKMTTRKLTFASLLIAMSFVLSFVKFLQMPQGGTVTLGSMIPIMLFAYLFGVREGLLAGAVYGLLQFIQEPYIVHWAQVLVDYPFAFAALGLAGLYRRNFTVAIMIGGVGRMIFHILSGAIFFASYAPEGMNPFWYSIVYNVSYLGPDLLLCILISLIPQFKGMVNKIRTI
ncbi:Thiamine transporter ThiT [Caloramator mitchellensis]|uniref:Thiamine transporter ThiT n=1 Tax=Caloramator mitchellensis TaxID=908809 RepID=A0A0R3JVL8_CALMK|nr:energy-coupled thiamine transporter ThiT [Caloramator mitchellensis]KRQ86349.1 Thiamine transporter ThiT [Caloramator mitchellensis]